MNAYEALATFYDHLIDDDFYTSYVARIEESLGTLNGKTIYDLGCGTGRLGALCLEKGASVGGIDLSERMIEEARREVPTGSWAVGKMQDVQLPSASYDVIVSTLDAVNYIESLDDVRQLFERVYEGLVRGGTFFFDIHSLHKKDILLYEAPFVYDDKELSYIWETSPNGSYGVDYSLLFYMNRGECYERKEEFHTQWFYPSTIYMNLLLDVGFTVEYIVGDEEDLEESTRYFISVKKDQ